MRRLEKQITCTLLIMLLLLPSIPPVLAEETNENEEADVLHISNAQELIDFAACCSLNTWSDGMEVSLDADISLSGVSFSPIPYFNGVFYGNGYTVYDLKISDAQSPCGLFLETGKEAVVFDLNVCGRIEPGRDETVVGGLVGCNAGMLSNCSFSGQIVAAAQVGGLVGKNEASGLITACRSAGKVSGLNDIGGIAGLNEGTLFACENNSYVNTESVDPSLRLETIDTSSILNFLHSFGSDKAGVTMNVGGIAGKNTGFVEHCVNNTTIGYLHLGYNIGGIVGRSSGYLNCCTNRGEIFGRKDVGGIAGQAEPFVEVEAAQNLLDSLDYRLNAVNQSINIAIADASGLSDSLTAELAGLPAFLQPLMNAFENMDLSQLPDMTQPILIPEGDVQQGENMPNQLPGNITDVLGKIPDTLNTLRLATEETVAEMSDEIRRIAENMDGSSDILIQDLQNISNNLSALSGTVMQTVYILSSEESYENILQDASADSIAETIVFGKLNECLNEGNINGDSNVGGVAGTISLENEMEPEADLSSSGNSLIQNRYSFHAVIVQCVNRGGVLAKRECVGGICGKMDLGVITNCAAYGTEEAEDGGYVGGICGLCYATVQNSCSKSSLKGEKYVGGVVGNGYTGKGDGGHSSLVSGCYSLVEIEGKPQYSGAVSGGSDGSFSWNYFVPSGAAGIDRLSVYGYAEPIDFNSFSQVEGIPEECKSFTLRFVVDGETVKTIPFSYGDSFDRSVFPEVERKDGEYAVWDRTVLNNLCFDTVVTAKYCREETVLRSASNRPDGRALIYVDGEFQTGDDLAVRVLDVKPEDIDVFRDPWAEVLWKQLHSIIADHVLDRSVCVAVMEKLEIVIPEDGLPEHTIRYLTGYESTDNYRIYWKTDNGWEQLQTELFGSYARFTLPGTDVEIALVETVQFWWILVFLIEAALMIPALVWLLVLMLKKWMRRKKQLKPCKQNLHVPTSRGQWVSAHRKLILLVTAAILSALVIAVGLVNRSNICSRLETYRLLKQFAGEECNIQTNISTASGENSTEISTVIKRVQKDGAMISCIQQYGLNLYINKGVVYLENGRAFYIGQSRLDQSAFINLVLKLLRSSDIEKEQTEDGDCYKAILRKEQAEEIIAFLLGEEKELLLGIGQPENVTVRLYEAEGRLAGLTISGEDIAEGGRKNAIKAALKIQEMTECPLIPEAVQNAMRDDQIRPEVFSENLLRLISAWIRNETSNAVGAEIAVKVNCGILNLDSRYTYFRENLEGFDISAVSSKLFTVYYTDTAACTSKGNDLNEAEQRILNTTQLIPIAKELFSKGNFESQKKGDSDILLISLSPADAESIAERIVPEMKELNIIYDECVISITLQENSLSSIELHFTGRMRMVARDITTRLDVLLNYTEPGVHQIPYIVQQKLMPTLTE